MTVGRISGPLLKSNLERNGIDLYFANTVSDTALLYFDVNTGKIGVNTNTPTDGVGIIGTQRATNAIVDTQSDIANFTIATNNVNTLVGDINLNALEAIKLSNFETDNIHISDNSISTHRSNANLDLIPNGVGTVEVQTNLEVFGNLHSAQNITADGNVIIGNNADDNLILNADLANDLIPATTNTYSLGTNTKRWNNLYTDLVNGKRVVINELIASGGGDFSKRQGNIFFVSVNGNDTNSGDNAQSPFATLKRALQAADASISGPVSIHVYAGEYQEELPLTVPSNVSVIGEDMRNTIITPDTNTQSSDVFLLNGESTVQNLTIKNFYSPGYAFKFAFNTVISTRSPYIQNVTVITQGTTTSASDPRGFASGDAGGGAYIDGASVNSASQEASMLFHSSTFITPGVDAITMTNGVRVEWLNSFTYFANRGLYAVDGVTGHLSTDGSTVKYGAEIRSIGSANVYGNYGAVADGADTLMYLIQHNMAYIGAGKFTDNDPSRVVQTNETLELNSGTIYYQTVDHLGNFRVGDEFFVDLETGSTSIVITEAQVDALNGLTITTNGQTTIIDGDKVETGNIRFSGNTIESLAGSVFVSSSNGNINLQKNTNVTGNVDMTGDISIGGSVITLGNDVNDTVDFNTPFSQNLQPDVSGLYSLGSATKTWKKAWLSELQADDILIKDNYITTTVSNSDLELIANGIGKLYVPNNNFTITNELTVSTLTDLQNVNITGTVLHTGDTTVSSNLSIIGNLTLTQDLDVGSLAQFEEILVDGNVITTTTTNADLELRAAGVGSIIFDEDTTILNDLTVRDILSSDNIILETTIAIENIKASSDIDIFDNVITTTNSNSDLELRANGTGSINFEDIIVNEELLSTDTANLEFITDANLNVTSTAAMRIPTGNDAERIASTANIRFNGQSNLFEGYATDVVNFDGVYSSNRLTNVLAHKTNDTIGLTVNSVKVGEVNSSGISIHAVQTDDININSNLISTTVSNSNLELQRDGTGKIVIGNLNIVGQTIINTNASGGLIFENTGEGYVKFAGHGAVLFPAGDNNQKGTNNQVGDTRYNTTEKYMEVYDGTQWIVAAGGGEQVTADFMEDLSNEWTLILG